MAVESGEETSEFGRVSRLRGIVFENLTRAASAIGVVALLLLIAYTLLDAVQPFTADTEWYLFLLGTFVVPSLAVGWYCWQPPARTRVALRATGATLAGLALATVLTLWLGGQLAMLTVLAVIVPAAVCFAALLRRRRAATVGVQTLGIVVAGGGVGSIASFFVGPQATLVFAVAVGIPAALLARYFLAHPAVGSVGVRATGVALLGAAVGAGGVTAVTLAGWTPGNAAAGVLGLGALAGVAAYAAQVLRRDVPGRLGLFAPFVLLTGALGGYLFHRTFVVVAPVAPLLYGVTAGLPALAFAAETLRGDDGEGATGLLLPVVVAVGIAAATLFHREYVVNVPTTVLAFALALAVTVGAYVYYVVSRDRPGRRGLAAPVVAGGGLLAGLLGAREFGIAGPDTWLDVGFLTRGSHYQPELTGIHPALVGSLYLMFVVTFVAFPVGIGAAIYLEEYASDSRFARLLEINIANLAGVPSVVYGLLGVAVFIRFGGLSLGAVLAGGFTLSLLILPIVIVTSQEAIRAVPDSLRQASYGMGATRWQTVRNVVLPRALPGILTSTILALGRAVGETAPLIMVGLAPIGGVPNTLTDQGTAMPLQVFAWALDARELFRDHVAAAGALTLLLTLVALNGVAVIIRNKYQREQ